MVTVDLGPRSDRMSARLVFWSLTSSLAGFLFGFDTVVISGAEQKLQSLWGLDTAMHGAIVASALYGTMLGALVGGWPTDRYGRKPTLIGIGVLYVVSAIGSALANDPYVFVLARLVGGLGIGISTVASPLYIAEIAPAEHRGRLAGMFQFNIVFGIVIAYLSNALLGGIGPHAWRWMLGVAAIPSLLYTGLCFGLPESPRWLFAKKNDVEEGMSVLRRLYPSASEERLHADAQAMVSNRVKKGRTGRFWSYELRKPIFLAFSIAMFNQLSGINAILYFAPRIFEMTGLEERSALLQSVGIGATNLAFTVLGLRLIDRVGRRTLLYVGSFGYVISLALTAWAFSSGHLGIVPSCIFAFIAAHAIGQGTVIWVFISEIFPTQHRAAGQALGSLTHWSFAALLTTVFPKMVAAFSPATVFSFFCGMMVLQLVWLKTAVPETKGVPLEDMPQRLDP